MAAFSMLTAMMWMLWINLSLMCPRALRGALTARRTCWMPLPRTLQASRVRDVSRNQLLMLLASLVSPLHNAAGRGLTSCIFAILIARHCDCYSLRGPQGRSRHA